MQLHYLEMVTPEVKAACSLYERCYGLVFSAPVAALGGARTATLPDGTQLGIRAAMHSTEAAVTRPYFLVEDINTAVEEAVTGGAELMHPPLELTELGQFAIVGVGDLQLGFWQL